jgi:crotonobetainyl-CoA:carnitine CoA-transferase CaiB-like acyl-CoA transferase
LNPTPAPPPPEHPLTGIRVVEIGHSVAAPFCGQVLADLGADVIKIENPKGGDDARHWGPPFVDGTAATFHALNRNKRTLGMLLEAENDQSGLVATPLRFDGKRPPLRTLAPDTPAAAEGLGAVAVPS